MRSSKSTEPMKVEVRKKLRWFVVALLIGTLLFAAHSRKVEVRYTLDVHSGKGEKIRRGYWGGITKTASKPWRASDFESVFPDESEPKWLLLKIVEYTQFPDLSRRGRRRGTEWSETDGNSFIPTLNLSQVLDAPHIDRKTRQQIIYRSFDNASPDKPVRNFHILDDLRQAVLDATDFPPEDRARWQTAVDNDEAGDITVFLHEATSHPAKEATP
jgi:hypothetical protein